MCSVGCQIFVGGQRLEEKLELGAWQSTKVKQSCQDQRAAVKLIQEFTLRTT